MNQLTTNSDNTTNENLITERDRPMTSNNAKSFDFKENMLRKKLNGTGICGVTLSVAFNGLVGY